MVKCTNTLKLFLEHNSIYFIFNLNFIKKQFFNILYNLYTYGAKGTYEKWTVTHQYFGIVYFKFFLKYVSHKMKS